MGRRYEETLAEIEYNGLVTLNLEAIAEPMTARLCAMGCDFDAVGTVEDAELQFLSRTLIVSVLCDPDKPSLIRISAETPVGLDTGRAAAELRLAATTAAVQHFIGNLPAERVTLRHKGQTYVIATNCETQISAPMVRSVMADLREIPQDISFKLLAAPRHARVDDVPGVWDYDIMASQRDILHGAPPPDGPDRNPRSLPEKLTVYALNTTVMVLSLPVGAGLLTYNVLRGGSIAGTSRALALTGTAIGLSALPVTQSLASSARSMASTAQTSVGFSPVEFIKTFVSAPIDMITAAASAPLDLITSSLSLFGVV